MYKLCSFLPPFAMGHLADCPVSLSLTPLRDTCTVPLGQPPPLSCQDIVVSLFLSLNFLLIIQLDPEICLTHQSWTTSANKKKTTPKTLASQLRILVLMTCFSAPAPTNGGVLDLPRLFSSSTFCFCDSMMVTSGDRSSLSLIE